MKWFELAPSDCYLFLKIKKELRGCNFDAVGQDSSFYTIGIRSMTMGLIIQMLEGTMLFGLVS